jgi:hypothetical protein
MAQLIMSGDEYRDLTYDEAHRSYPITGSDAPNDYRFGRLHRKRIRAPSRTALGRVNGFLRSMIEAIADSKIRRMERELELRGIRFDRSSGNWAGRTPGRTGVF